MAIKKNATEKNIEVTRAHQFKDDSVIFDMVVNDVTIYGCRIVEGKKGDFVSFPSHKGSDGKYYSYARVELSDDDIRDIENAINDLL